MWTLQIKFCMARPTVRVIFEKKIKNNYAFNEKFKIMLKYA